MKYYLILLLRIIMIAYFASIVVFFQNYINITYVINLVLVIIFLLLMIIDRVKVYNINKIIIFYTVFTLFGFASSFWAIEFYDAAYKGLQLTLVLFDIFIMYNLFKQFSLLYTFSNGILLASFVNYLILLGFISVPFEIIMPGGGNRAIGTAGNPNVLSIVMLISILCSIIYLYQKERLNKLFYFYQYINILLALYMIFLTVSKKGIIFSSLLIGLYFLLSMKSVKGIVRIIIFLILVSIFLLYFIDLNDVIGQYQRVVHRFTALDNSLSGQAGGFDSTTIRKNLILSGLDAIQDKPLFGYGLNNFYHVSWNGQYAHNNYIEILANGGLVAFFIFYSMYVYIIKILSYEKIKDLRYLLYLFIFIMLIMDMAVVSYGSKFEIYFLIFLSVYLEDKNKKINTQVS